MKKLNSEYNDTNISNALKSAHGEFSTTVMMIYYC